MDGDSNDLTVQSKSQFIIFCESEVVVDFVQKVRFGAFVFACLSFLFLVLVQICV